MVRIAARTLGLVVVLMLAVRAYPAMAITGLWSGELRDPSGNGEMVRYRFTASGNPVLGFETRHGYQEVEIQAVGQQRKWLLPGSGWAMGTVQALSVRPDQVHVLVRIYSESGSGALLDQSERLLGLRFMLSGSGLQTTVVVEDLSHGSGAGVGLYASQRSRKVYQGVLYRDR